MNQHHLPKWAFAFVRFKTWLLVCAAIITGVMGYFAVQLRFDFSPDNIFLKGDPAHLFYTERFLPAFGEHAKLCVIALDGDVKEPQTQSALFALHHAIVQQKSLGTVRSLVNTQLLSEQDGLMQLMPIFDAQGVAQPALLDFAARDRLLSTLMLAKDQKAAAVVVQLPLENGNESHNEALVTRLQETVVTVAERFPQQRFYVTGLPVTSTATVQWLKLDQLRFVPLLIVLMGLFLWLSFRNWRGVLLPFLATGAAAVWALGLMVLWGHPVNIVNNALIVLLLVIGVADAIHVLARYNFELERMRAEALRMGLSQIDKAVLIARTTRYMLLPVTLTTVTAALGFACSAIADVQIIRHFGVDAAVGVMCSLFTTMLIVPALLAFMPLPKERKQSTGPLSLERILTVTTHFSLRHAKAIIVMACVLFIAALWVAKEVRPSQTLIGELPASAPSVEALRFIEARLTGLMPFDLVYEGEKSQFEDPQTLKSLAQMAQWIRQQPLAPTVLSFTDVLQSFAVSMSSGEDTSDVSTWSEEKIAQFLLLFELSDPDLLKQVKADFFSDDGKLYRIQGLLNDASTSVYSDLRSTFEKQLVEKPIASLKAHVTGATMIAAKALDHVIFDLMRALSIGIVVIFLLMSVLFRSIRYGLIGLLPNLLPLALTAAVLQVTGISFRVATVIIFTMSIGIAVDTCIHLLTRFRQELQLQHIREDFLHLKPIEAVILRTICASGKPVTYAMVMLLAGFSVMIFSQFVAMRDFAILSSVTLGSSLVIDLLLVPALLVTFLPKAK